MEGPDTITNDVATSGSAPGAPPSRPAGDTAPATLRIRLARMLLLAAIATVFVTVAGTAFVISGLRTQALDANASGVQNIAAMLTEEADRSLQALDLLEKNLSVRLQRLDVTSASDLEQRLSGYDAHLLLKDTISGLPQVASVAIIGAQGKPVNSSRRWPTPAFAVVDRDYYKALASDPQVMSFLSAPIHNRVDQTRSILLARKLVGPNHDFIGLVIAALDLTSIEEMFGSVALGDGVEIAFVRTDGTLLAHYPRLAASVERQDDRGQLFDDGAWVPKQDSSRVSATRDLANFPARIYASAPMAAALSNWRSQAMYLAGTAALLVAMIGGVAFAAAGQLERYATLLKMEAETVEADAAHAADETVMAEREQSHQQFDTQMLHLRSTIEHIPQGIVMFDANARLVVCNQNYIEMYKLSPNLAMPGRKLRDIIAFRVRQGGFTANPDALAADVVATVFKGKPWKSVAELRDGRIIDILTQPMSDGGWVAVHEDITERRRAERHLDRTQNFLASVIEHVPTTITVKDARDLRYLLTNRAGEKYLGLSRSEIIGKTAYDLFPKETADVIVGHDRQLLASGKEVFIDEHVIRTPAGQERLVIARRLPVANNGGEPEYLLSLIDDITERRQVEQRIAHIEHHDALTGLPNRMALARHLAEKVDRAAAENSHFAVLSLDLDRFEEINDVFGRTIGDALMRECAHRLSQAATGAYLAHVGSDEFILTTVSGPEPATAEALSKRLIAAMDVKFEIEGHRLRAGLSIGIALFPGDGSDAATLQANADAARHRAKAEGRGTYRFFEADLDSTLRDRRALYYDLTTALERGELAIDYQPQARHDGEVIGFEALIRWHHPTRGLVSPSEFIPLAEESRNMAAIGEWILREACHEAASWTRPLQIAVNVSPTQFRYGDLVGLIQRVLHDSGLPAGRLEIEITEGSLIGDFSRAVSILRRLKLLGVHIAMDDFGAGYSSLSHLRSFPYDKVKIDRSFLTDLDGDPQAGAMLRGVIDLAHGLNLTVLAEGVETNEQFAILHAASCDEMQGFLIGPPGPIETYAHLLGSAAAARPQVALAS